MNEPALHQDFAELKAEVSGLRAEVTYLRDDFKEARGEIKELTAALNQARGAKAASYAMSAIISLTVSVLSFFLGAGFFTKGH